MKKFSIHESNLERLQKKIGRIRNKCHKYGCDFAYAEVGEEFKTRTDDNGVEHVERYVIVEAEGTAKVNGWKFLGTINRTDAGNILRLMSDEVVVPEYYYNCEPECEHCHSRRHRKETYLVYNEETKEFKQVGSSCLNDFTNGLSAEAVANYISLFDELIEGEAPGESWGGKVWYEIPEVLTYAVDFVQNIGYASTYITDDYGDRMFNPNSTKSWVSDAIDYKQGRAGRIARERIEDYMDRYHPNYQSEDLANKVSTIIDWFKSVDCKDNNYMHNLQVLANSDYCEYKELGYVVSMVVTYNKHIAQEAEKARKASELAKEAEASAYVGAVGDKIVVENPTFTAITGWDTQFGYTTRYKITDEFGHVFMWDTSSYIEDPSYYIPVSIKGTVKKLDEFRGVKQTWLTRCHVSYKDVE